MDRCQIFDEKIPNNRRPGTFQRVGGWAGMLLDQNHSIDDHTILQVLTRLKLDLLEPFFSV